MVIDDQEPIVRVARRQLRQLGCAVVGFHSAAEAMAHLAAHPREIDLLLADFAMPEVLRLEVARTALRLRPDLPVVVDTGFVEVEIQQELESARVLQVIQKPSFLKADLERLVTEVADPTTGPCNACRRQMTASTEPVPTARVAHQRRLPPS